MAEEFACRSKSFIFLSSHIITASVVSRMSENEMDGFLKIDCEVSFLVARFRELVIGEGTLYFFLFLKNCLVMHSHFVVSNVKCCEGTDYMMEVIHNPMLDFDISSKTMQVVQVV